MIPDKKSTKKRTRNWLKQLSHDLDQSPDLVDAMPIEEVRAQLADAGLDVKGFHSRLARTLALTKTHHLGTALIKWASPIWEPQWAGQRVTAGDIPAQQHVFHLPQGKGHIDIRCSWRPAYGATPAYMELSWQTNTVMEGELWCQFIQSETQVVLKEIGLGSNRDGGKYFSADFLGFNPSTEPWTLSMLLKETAPPDDGDE